MFFKKNNKLYRKENVELSREYILYTRMKVYVLIMDCL